MTKLEKRCPFRYFNHLANTSLYWDNRCKLEEGHEGEHIQFGSINPIQSQQNYNQFLQTGWVKTEE